VLKLGQRWKDVAKKRALQRENGELAPEAGADASPITKAFITDFALAHLKAKGQRNNRIHPVVSSLPKDKDEGRGGNEEKGDSEGVTKEEIPSRTAKECVTLETEEPEDQKVEDKELTKLEIFFLSCLMISLFFGDWWDSQNFPDEDDYQRNTIVFMLFVIFVIEFATICYSDAYYVGSTFFYLDIIGTLVVLLDLSWMINFISGGSSVSILRATRASKVGVRSKQIFKFVVGSFRLFRAIRPIFNTVFRSVVSMRYETGNGEDLSDKTTEEKKPLTQEQLIIQYDIEGKQDEVTEGFAFRIAGIVMILILVVPVLQVTPIDYSPNAWIAEMKYLCKSNRTTIIDIEKLANSIHKYYNGDNNSSGKKKKSKNENHPLELIHLTMETPYIHWNSTFSKDYSSSNKVIRKHNVYHYDRTYKIANSILLASAIPAVKDYSLDLSQDYTKFILELHLDATSETRTAAVFSMLSTLLVIIVLFFGTSTISTSTEKLILLPLRDALLALCGEAWGNTSSSSSASLSSVTGDAARGTEGGGGGGTSGGAQKLERKSQIRSVRTSLNKSRTQQSAAGFSSTTNSVSMRSMTNRSGDNVSPSFSLSKEL
jgi:hypothetical protein